MYEVPYRMGVCTRNFQRRTERESHTADLESNLSLRVDVCSRPSKTKEDEYNDALDDDDDDDDDCDDARRIHRWMDRGERRLPCSESPPCFPPPEPALPVSWTMMDHRS